MLRSRSLLAALRVDLAGLAGLDRSTQKYREYYQLRHHEGIVRARRMSHSVDVTAWLNHEINKLIERQEKAAAQQR